MFLHCLTYVLALKSLMPVQFLFTLSHWSACPGALRILSSSLKSPGFIRMSQCWSFWVNFPRYPVSLVNLSFSQFSLSVKFSPVMVLSQLCCVTLFYSFQSSDLENISSFFVFPSCCFIFLTPVFSLCRFPSLGYAPALLWCPLLIFTWIYPLQCIL